MKRLLITLLILVIALVTFAQDAAPKLDLIELVKNFDWLNIALLVISLVAGGFFLTARQKLKQISELFAMAYEFTDDKVLDKSERRRLIDQFMLIIGRKKAAVIHDKAKAEITAKQRPENRAMKGTKI